jgi:serine/threonine-protein kinase RsbW
MGANPPESNAYGERMRVIVIETDTTIRDTVTSAFATRGHTVTPVDSVDEAVRWIEAGVVDLVVTDLASATAFDARLVRSIHSRRTPVPIVVTTVETDSLGSDLIRTGSADVLAYPFGDDALDEAIEKAQAHHLLHGDALKIQPFLTERIEFVIPSRVEYLDGILDHLSERLSRLHVVEPESIEVIVALDEAIVNAIKHGNGYDPSKHVSIVATISNGEAQFEITDEGNGFSEQDVPDPCAPENLLRTTGRGILLIRNIMDDVAYNERGNRITMIKRAAPRRTHTKPSGSGVTGAGQEPSGSSPVN